MTTPTAARKGFPLILALGLLTVPACAKAERSTDMQTASAPVVAQAAAGGQTTPSTSQGGEAAERKIIRSAELTIESRDVAASRDRAIRLVEQAGGYVASSTENQGGHDDEWSTVQLSFKVPADKLSALLTELRGVGTRTAHEHVGSQDVTAEFYDTEARLKAQRAVEAQLLVIAREAHTVPDLLAVQRQLGEVRGEIERMEGRRNQIVHQVSLSTVQLTVRREQAVASASIVSSVQKAGGDAVSVGAGLIHGSIRAAGVLTPLALFFGPLGYVGFRLLRRLRRRAVLALFRPCFAQISAKNVGVEGVTGGGRFR
jgi:hypothetical protein